MGFQHFMDIMFAFTEWLRTTPVNDFALWVGTTRLSIWLGSHFWAIPIMQTLHILAMAMAFGSVLMINLKVLGLRARTRTMASTVRRYQPWIWWSFLVLVITGVGMSTAEPTRNLINPFFWTKMGLILALVLISLGFHAVVGRRMAQWEVALDGAAASRAGTQVAAALLILLWCMVIFAGRWIAYAPV